LRFGSGEPENPVAKLAALELSPALAHEVAPLVALFAPLNAAIAAADARLERVAKEQLVVARLTTMPMIGPITALAFVAALDDVTRDAAEHRCARSPGLAAACLAGTVATAIRTLNLQFGA